MQVVDWLVPEAVFATAMYGALRTVARLLRPPRSDARSIPLPPMSADWLVEHEATSGKHDRREPP